MVSSFDVDSSFGCLFFLLWDGVFLAAILRLLGGVGSRGVLTLRLRLRGQRLLLLLLLLRLLDAGGLETQSIGGHLVLVPFQVLFGQLFVFDQGGAVRITPTGRDDLGHLLETNLAACSGLGTTATTPLLRRRGGGGGGRLGIFLLLFLLFHFGHETSPFFLEKVIVRRQGSLGLVLVLLPTLGDGRLLGTGDPRRRPRTGRRRLDG